MHRRTNKKCFCHEKFKKQLFAASITMTVVFLMSLSDTLIAGNMIGEAAITGLNVVSPLLTIISFVSMMIGTGTAYRFSYEMGGFRQKRANRFAGQGLILAVAASLLMFVAVFFGKDLYFAFVETSESAMQHTRAYYTWYPFIAATYPPFILFQDLIYANGDTKTCTAANVVQVIGNIVVSIICCYFVGVSGISLGTLIGNLLSIAILSTHFFKKKSSLRFTLHLAMEDILTVFKFSYVHASIYLYSGIASLIINKYFLSVFGEKFFPVLTVMYGITGLTMIFDGVGQAMEPITNIYQGEGNSDGIRKIMSYAVKICLIEGVVSAVVLLVAGESVAAVYNINSSELIAMTGVAVRIYAPAMIFFSVLYLFEMHYLLTGHIAFSVLISLFKNLLMPVGLSLLLALPFSLNGIWIGLLLAPIITFVIFFIILYVRHRNSFPLLLEKKDIVSMDITVSHESVIQLRDWIEAECDKRNIENALKNRTMLLTEEIGMLIAEKNDTAPLLEATLFFGDEMKMIIRDNGVTYNAADADENLNFRSIIFSNLLSSIVSTGYLVTGNYNRNVFTLTKSE